MLISLVKARLYSLLLCNFIRDSRRIFKSQGMELLKILMICKFVLKTITLNLKILCMHESL